MKDGVLLLFKLYKHHKEARRRLKRLNYWKRYHIIGYKPSGLPITKNPPMPKRVMESRVIQKDIANNKWYDLPAKDLAILFFFMGSIMILYINNMKQQSARRKQIMEIEQVLNSKEEAINKIISEQYKNK